MHRYLFLFTVLIPSYAVAQLATANPEDVGVSSERLADVTAYMQELVDNDQVSGGVIMMARHGKVVLHEAVGMMDRESKKPMTKDAIFRIASMTKPITSVAVMMLVEEGKLGLYDPVSKYIPEFANTRVLVDAEAMDTVAAKPEITIRDLLRHTSGLTYFEHPATGPLYKQARITAGVVQDPTPLKAITERLASVPLAFHPGTQWKYGMSTDVLGRVVEVVAEVPLDKFFHERIFVPLGMTDTYFHVPAAKVSRIPALYRFDNDGHLLRVRDGERLRLVSGTPYSADYPYQGKRWLSGGAGLCSTASDYIRFCQTLLNDGTLNGRRLLRAESVRMMTSNQLGKLTDSLNEPGNQTDQTVVGFGFGFLVIERVTHLQAGLTVDSYGWGGVFSTNFDITPNGDWSLVTMLQVAWNDKTDPWMEEFTRRAAAAVVD